MYPFMRMTFQMSRAGKATKLPNTGTHISHHICWPWDLDFWAELNNGRALTLYDLGRLPLARRSGLLDVLKDQRWGMTVAGSSVRYRRRVRMMAKITMKSRAIGWDERFIYMEQSMWLANGDCAGHLLMRMAVTSKAGIVAPDAVLTAWGEDTISPPLPDWVLAWKAAEDMRPWPPMGDV